VTRSYLYLFLSHRHAVLSRGTQRNRQKLSECSNSLQNILFPIMSAWRPSQTFSSGHRAVVALPGWTYKTPGRIYLVSRIYSAPIGFQKPWQLLRSDISNPPDFFSLHRVPVPCHFSLIGYIRAPSDISNPAEFEPV
jgi:hypothetical protein